MMDRILIDLPPETHRWVWAHLLPKCLKDEEVCFLHIRLVSSNGGKFVFVDWDPIPPKDFAHRSAYCIELADETRARVIKRAHDLGTSLVEMHSHIASRPAAFSPSDMMGFAEFVPHVLWRLQGKPYFAIVVARGSFDGLVWLHRRNNPQRLDGIAVGPSLLLPTRLSPLRREAHGY